MSWNFSDTYFRNLGTISSTTTVNNLKLIANSSKTMSVIKSPQTLNGTTYNYCLALGGGGSGSSVNTGNTGNTGSSGAIDANGYPDQLMQFVNTSDGKYLNVSGTNNNAAINSSAASATTNKWKLVKKGTDYYQIVNEATGYVLAPNNNYVSSGVSVVAASNTGNIIFKNITFSHSANINANADIQVYISSGNNFWLDHCTWTGHASLTSSDVDKLLYVGLKADYVSVTGSTFMNHKYGLILGYPPYTGCQIYSEKNYFDKGDYKGAVVDDKGVGGFTDVG